MNTSILFSWYASLAFALGVDFLPVSFSPFSSSDSDLTLFSVSRSCRANRTVNYLLLLLGQPNSQQSFRVVLPIFFSTPDLPRARRFRSTSGSPISTEYSFFLELFFSPLSTSSIFYFFIPAADGILATNATILNVSLPGYLNTVYRLRYIEE